MFKQNVLSPREIWDLNPRRKEAYASNIVKETLKKNPDGLTINQVAEKTALSKNTAVKHLVLF